MRRQGLLNTIGHQSLMHSESPSARECVCNYRVLDVFFMGFGHLSPLHRIADYPLLYNR